MGHQIPRDVRQWGPVGERGGGSAFHSRLGQPAGWIGIYQVEDERPLNTRELLFLSSISRLAGLGVEKIDLVEALQKRTLSQDTLVQDSIPDPSLGARRHVRDHRRQRNPDQGRLG